MKPDTYNYTKANNDLNGNPRYIVHFLAFVNDADRKRADFLSEHSRPYHSAIHFLYQIAVNKSRKMGGQKYKGKDFGGGIVFQSHNIDEDMERIAEIKQM